MSPLRLKVEFDGQEKRRFSLLEPITFEHLKSLLKSARSESGQQVKNIVLKYLDDEGELIAIISDADLREAIILSTEMNQKVLKLLVTTEYTDTPDDKKLLSNQVKNDDLSSLESTVQANNHFNESKESAGESKKDHCDEAAVETTEFNTALQTLVDLFFNENFPIEEIPAFVMVCSTFLEGSEGQLLWENLLFSIKERVPKIASLECFHEPKSEKLINSLEIVTNYLVKNAESGLIYPIPLKYSSLSFLTSEPVLNEFLKIKGLPQRIQTILENLVQCVAKIESLYKSSPQESDSGAESKTIPTHEGITCDGCEMSPIVGSRFKCTVCRDFDLCETCEASNKHARDHEMIKLYVPSRTFSFGINKRGWGRPRCPMNRQSNHHPRGQVEMSSQFERNVNIPDGTVLQGGDLHVKSWKVRNNGKVDWDNSVKLMYVSGDKQVLLDNQLVYDVVNLKSGEVGEINVPMMVPSVPGTYQVVFKLAKNDVFFGHEIWVKFVAVC